MEDKVTKERLNSTIKYTAISVGIAIVSMPVIFFVIFLFIMVPPEPSIAKMEKELIKNKEEIMTVVDFLAEHGSKEVYIDNDVLKEQSFCYDGDFKKEELSCDTVVYKAIEKLSKVGYREYNKEKSTITFKRWSSIDISSGIAYTLDGSKPVISELSVLKPLSESGWYYYFTSYDG